MKELETVLEQRFGLVFSDKQLLETAFTHTSYAKMCIRDRSTTVQILDEVAQGHSEIGIIYLNNQNQKGIMQRVEKLGLEVIELIP